MERSSERTVTNITLVGHRGAAALAPENTLPAFEAAVASGVRMLETDVRLTRDHRLICFHDDRLDRVTAAKGVVSEHDWADLQDLAVLPGSFEGRFPDARIPLLREVLSAVPDTCRFCVEIKTDAQSPGGAVAKAALECLRAADVLARTRVIAFDAYDLRGVRRLSQYDATLEPAELGIVCGRAQLPYWRERAVELKANTIHFDHRLVLKHPALIAEAHDLGYRVNVWTVNDAETAAKMIEAKADELTTDDPILLSRITALTPNT